MPVAVVAAGAWSFRWIQEDAFIDIRVIRNLLAGQGPVYNPGQRVEVYTDPLWLFSQAALHLALPFASVEWTEIVTGMACTVGGVVLGGRAVQRLAASRGEGPVAPVGLLVFSACAGVWEFSTSGLETSLVFLWIGLSLWTIVRVEVAHTSPFLCAVVLGAGPLIRPELALMAGVFLLSLVLVFSSRNRGSGRLPRRIGLLVASMLSLPVTYEIFRIGYFGMLVPNTALAKSAASAWWDQGFIYLWNFLSPYTLWFPLALALGAFVPVVLRWFRNSDYVGTVLLLTPVVAGVLDILYIVRLGGDYMHARLLLPGFCAICTGLFVSLRNGARLLAVACILPVAVWAFVAVAWLRPPANERAAQRIDNERTFWIGYSGTPHPIEPAQFRGTLTYHWSEMMNGIARHTPPGRSVLVLGTGTVLGATGVTTPCRVITDSSVIGLAGVLVRPDVCIFDLNSLADPIGSHTGAQHSRFGKALSTEWMISEYGSRTLTRGRPRLQAGRRALSCGPMGLYLRDISGPVTAGKFASDLVHAVSFTRMTIDADPVVAERKACG